MMKILMSAGIRLSYNRDRSTPTSIAWLRFRVSTGVVYPEGAKHEQLQIEVYEIRVQN